MATIQDIKSAIMFGDFDNDQLAVIVDAIKYRRAEITREAKRSFWNGDAVKFTNPKTGRVHTGVVVKVNIKKIVVREGNTNWNVPALMLSAA